MNARIETLSILQTAIWQALEHAPRDRSHGFRHLTLASRDGDGEVDARTVILRDVVAEQRRLAIYSDSRSAKVAQLRQQPQAMLVAWCPKLSWQLRLRVAFEVLDDGLDVSSRWARLKLSPAAQDYLSPLAPGTPVERWQELHGVRATREHFCVLWARVQSVDWLELHPDGHRRARFDADGARWLAP